MIPFKFIGWNVAAELVKSICPLLALLFFFGLLIPFLPPSLQRSVTFCGNCYRIMLGTIVLAIAFNLGLSGALMTPKTVAKNSLATLHQALSFRMRSAEAQMCFAAIDIDASP